MFLFGDATTGFTDATTNAEDTGACQPQQSFYAAPGNDEVPFPFCEEDLEGTSTPEPRHTSTPVVDFEYMECDTQPSDRTDYESRQQYGQEPAGAPQTAGARTFRASSAPTYLSSCFEGTPEHSPHRAPARINERLFTATGIGNSFVSNPTTGLMRHQPYQR